MKNILALCLLLITSTHAQDGAAGQAPGIANFVPIIAIFIIIYFLMIRPQKKQLEEEKTLLAGLNKGDEVYTKAGILGTIVGMTEKVITLEVAENTKLKVLRSQVGGLSAKLFEKKEEERSLKSFLSL